MGSLDFRATSDGFPIGAVVQSPIDLEKITNGMWVYLDGRDANRSDFPEVEKHFHAGVFTTTERTLNAAPAYAAGAADSTNFLLPGAAGTSALQASADGITWSTSATWGASTGVAALIVAGSRYVIAGSGGDMSAPYVSTTGQTAANQVAKSNWTATTGGASTTNTQGLAYSSSLALTVLIPNGASANIYTLADAATAWTTRTATSITKVGVTWSGQKFVVVGAPAAAGDPIPIQTSSDGTTWADSKIPFGGTMTNPQPIASDGNGTVVVGTYSPLQTATTLYVSKDHGSTWRIATIPDMHNANGYGSYVQYIEYVNSKFVAVTSGGSGLISNDGMTWHFESVLRRGPTTVANTPRRPIYKSGVYLFASSTTAAYTATEDMSKFKLPFRIASAAAYASGVATRVVYPEFMKVRSK